jgi:hypothetical protein
VYLSCRTLAVSPGLYTLAEGEEKPITRVNSARDRRTDAFAVCGPIRHFGRLEKQGLLDVDEPSMSATGLPGDIDGLIARCRRT